MPGSRHALIAAAQNGHLDIVEYLLDTAELIVSTFCCNSLELEGIFSIIAIICFTFLITRNYQDF